MTPAITSLLYASSTDVGTRYCASGRRKLSVVSHLAALAASTARKTVLNDEIVMVRPGPAGGVPCRTPPQLGHALHTQNYRELPYSATWLNIN
jgi:hypothetical protein